MNKFTKIVATISETGAVMWEFLRELYAPV